jgi:hypothetical protein
MSFSSRIGCLPFARHTLASQQSQRITAQRSVIATHRNTSQCIAAHCSASQRIAAHRSASQRIAAHRNASQRIAAHRILSHSHRMSVFGIKM